MLVLACWLSFIIAGRWSYSLNCYYYCLECESLWGVFEMFHSLGRAQTESVSARSWHASLRAWAVIHATPMECAYWRRQNKRQALALFGNFLLKFTHASKQSRYTAFCLHAALFGCLENSGRLNIGNEDLKWPVFSVQPDRNKCEWRSCYCYNCSRYSLVLIILITFILTLLWAKLSILVKHKIMTFTSTKIYDDNTFVNLHCLLIVFHLYKFINTFFFCNFNVSSFTWIYMRSCLIGE